MFEAIDVLSEKELYARNEVKRETYTKKVQIEARVLGDLSMKHHPRGHGVSVGTAFDNIYKMHAVFSKEKVRN